MNISPTTKVGKKRSIGSTQQFLAVIRGFHTQTDSKLHVCAHLIGHYAGRALGRQNQRDAKGATQSHNTFELGLVVRVRRDHLGKLIYDDEQVGKRFWLGIVGGELWCDV